MPYLPGVCVRARRVGPTQNADINSPFFDLFHTKKSLFFFYDGMEIWRFFSTRFSVRVKNVTIVTEMKGPKGRKYSLSCN